MQTHLEAEIERLEAHRDAKTYKFTGVDTSVAISDKGESKRVIHITSTSSLNTALQHFKGRALFNLVLDLIKHGTMENIK